MSAMEQVSPQSRFYNLTRWFVPLAALIAFAVWFYIAPPGLLGKADASVMPSAIALMSVPSISEIVNCRCVHVAQASSMRLGSRCSFLPSSAQGKAECPAGNLVYHYFSSFLRLELTAQIHIFICSNKPLMARLNNIPNLYIPNNTLRLFTGSGMGIALASILYPAFNQTAWKESDPQPALDWKKLGILIGIILLVDLAILTEHPAVLYPIAILSVLGVLALLIIVFSMVWLLMMRQENVFTTSAQMWMPLLAGTTLAFLMITAIDLLRFRLTGTWGGFPLG